MKKILIGVLIILLLVMACFAIFKGISIKDFKILSVEQIGNENEKLDQQISQVETLIHSTYATKTEELEDGVDDMMKSKDEYLELASISTDGELSQANRQETYKIEYLWTRIGSHATSEGVTLKLDVGAGETGESDVKNLTFTISGSYIAIINFVSSIEDDSQLGFKIENFKILPGEGEGGRQATFVVRNVRIKPETVTRNVTPATDSTTNNTTDDKTNNKTNEVDGNSTNKDDDKSTNEVNGNSTN